MALGIWAMSCLSQAAWAFPGSSFLDPAGPIAAAQKHHFIWVTLITLIVVLPAIFFTPYLAWRYRYGAKKSEYRPKWKFSWPLEILIWGVPTIIVLVLGVNLWNATSSLDPYKPLASRQKPLQIEVIGLDWKWLFIYPKQGIATVGQMALPVGRPVSIDLTTDSVMQSFIIPALGSQIYAMAGMRTRLNLQADRTGQFLGMNTQFNGTGFEHQKFLAIAMKDNAFQSWVQQVRNKGIALDPKTYATLDKRSTRAQSFISLGTSAMPQNVLYFSTIPEHFFKTVIARYRTGHALPPRTQPGIRAPGSAATASPKSKTSSGI